MSKAEIIRLNAELAKVRAEATRRELMLLAIVARYSNELALKYPTAARAFEDMQAEIIALTVDWD